MSSELSLSIMKHPFRRDLREDVPVPFAAGVSILDLRKKHFPMDLPVLVYLNGGLVSEDLWATTFPKPGDFVLFSVALSGGGSGGGKNIFRMVLMLAVSLAAMWAAPYLMGFTMFWGNTLLTGLLAGALTLVGGLVVNALIPPSQPKPAQDTSLDSQTYSWSPQNTEQQGVAVAKWYGLHRVYGNVIGSFIENQGTDQVINALVSLGLGPIKSLADFRINDQPCENFREVQIQARYGTLNQSSIDNFQNTRIEYPASVELLSNSPYVYLTTGADFDILEIDVSLPNGLWQSSGTSLQACSVDVRIEVRPAGTGSWIPITSHPEESYNFQYYSIAEGYPSPRWSRGKYIDIGGKTYWWNCEGGNLDYGDHREGDDAGSGLRWHWMGGVPAEYPDWIWDLRIETVVENFVQTAYDFTRITEAKAIPLHYTYRYYVPAGAKGQYEVRLTRVNADSSSTTVGDKTFFGGVREVMTDVFQYPRHVLVSVRARATDQLSGSIRFSCLGKMAIVQICDGITHTGLRPVHTAGSSTIVTTDQNDFAALSLGDEIIANGESRRIVQKVSANQIVVHKPVDWSAGRPYTWRHWVLDWSDNPAWVAYDIFTQPVIAGDGSAGAPYYVARFDSDIDPARIDLLKFKEWADHCDEPVPNGSGGTEKRVTFNGGFDFDCSMWEAVLRVCQVGRATPIWNGVSLSLAIDKPSDPVNLYTVGNIEASKFKETFLPLEERATEIEIDYTNVQNDYQRDKLTVYRPDVPNGQYKASLDLFGITKPSEAWRAGMYRINCNRYLIRTVEIDVDIEAVNGQIGDVVLIQHDVPRWGSGGRLVSALIRTRANLVKWPEDFTKTGTSGWVISNSAMAPNAAAAPNGSSTAWKLTDNNVSNTHMAYCNIAVSIGKTYTWSVFAKKGELNFLRLGLTNSLFLANNSVYFDLSNGVIKSGAGGSIKDMGDGWFRCSLTSICTQAGNVKPAMYLSAGGTTSTYVGNGSGVFIYGPQFEEAGAANAYVCNQGTVTDVGEIALDRTVTIEAGFTYKILLRLAEDVVYDLQVTDSPGEYTILHVTPAFDSSAAFDPEEAYFEGDQVRFEGKIYHCTHDTTVPSPEPPDERFWFLTSDCPIPEKYDVYAFGQVNTVAKPFRITDISRSQDQKVTLTLIEYRPEIYEFEEVEPPVNDFSQNRLLQMAPRLVRLSQGSFSGPGGRVSPTIEVDFSLPADPALCQVEVWFAERVGPDRANWGWIFAGAISATSFEIQSRVNYQTRYAVILIPVDTAGNKLYHGRAALYEITTQGPNRAADLNYANISGRAKLHTSGSSVNVTTTNGAFAWLMIGSRIIANSKVRAVADIIDPNTIRVDSAVDWDNAGVGYDFSYDTDLDSLAPSEGGSTNGGAFGDNIFWEGEILEDIDTDQLHPNSATAVTSVRVSLPPIGMVYFGATLKSGNSAVVMLKAVASTWSASPYIGTLNIYRGETLLDSVSILYPGAANVGPLVCMAIDSPGPGTYQYKLQTADSLLYVKDVIFKVMELRR